jgi:hydrogenase maturation protein HypF
LKDASNPIVVARLREPSPLAAEVIAGLGTVGLMLPTTPLHHLLVSRFSGPLVATSGNREGSPLEFDEQMVADELGGSADLFLHHDRPVLRPIDDAVVQVVAGRRATIRLARGLAPLPLELHSDHQIVALGGHQKSAIAVSNGAQAILGPHVGDLETEATRTRYLDHLDSMCGLYGVQPELLVTDLHPDYFTSRWAERQPTPKIAIQHHHAHVAAGMLQARWLDREVLGIAWDGTGLGTDGAIWGGEFLRATATSFDRVGCLRPFTLPGGELAIREPWRVGVSLVHQALGPEAAARLHWPDVSSRSVEQLVQLLAKSALFPITTSAGRLFDGVASLVLEISKSQFEGQPAMLLEGACDWSAIDSYDFPLAPGHPATLDWRPLIAAIADDLAARVGSQTIAMRFHRSLAAGILSVCDQSRDLPVVLCGGCFNNRILTELVGERFDGRFQEIELPGIIPSGDGGLAAGQLAVAAARVKCS